jgi:hypothetical protein
MWTADSDDGLEEDWELPDESEFDDDDDSQTHPCPECGADVYEDAEQCPVCGNYLIRDTNPLRQSSRPLAWLLLGLAGMAAVIVALLLC